jgi:hypothetical protein
MPMLKCEVLIFFIIFFYYVSKRIQGKIEQNVEFVRRANPGGIISPYMREKIKF